MLRRGTDCTWSPEGQSNYAMLVDSLHVWTRNHPNMYSVTLELESICDSSRHRTFKHIWKLSHPFPKCKTRSVINIHTLYLPKAAPGCSYADIAFNLVVGKPMSTWWFIRIIFKNNEVRCQFHPGAAHLDVLWLNEYYFPPLLNSICWLTIEFHLDLSH
jgi:hypothetical protein